MKQYIEVDAKRLAELVLVADLDECIDFAEEWDAGELNNDFNHVDGSSWHGIKRVNLFDEYSDWANDFGLIAIGMWGGGWTRVYDSTGDGMYLDTLEFVTDFIQQYFIDIECKTVLAELQVYEDGTTLLDKIRYK